MKTNAVVDCSTFRSSCQYCNLYKLCLSLGESGNDEEASFLDKRCRKIEHGEYLFREDDPFDNIYAIRTGSIKTSVIIENGDEQVTGYHLPSELLGLNAISKGVHTEAAVALETSSVCEIPFHRLEGLARERPNIQYLLLNAMSKEIQHDHYQLTMVSRMSAEARLASFLLCISYHFQQRGFSATEFNLSLSRGDIASLLGLAVETVSRLLSRFQKEGLLSVSRKYFILRDIEALKRISPKYSNLPYADYLVSNQAS